MKTKIKINITDIINNFDFDGTLSDYKEYGNGHINDTYLASFVFADGKEKQYIIQRINSDVFKNPYGVMENIINVTEYLQKIVIANGGNPDREVVCVIKPKNGKSCYKDENGNYWRVLTFISDAVSLDLPETENDFYQSGVAFGNFQKMLRDFPAETLHETIKDFHNTPKRYENFIAALNENKSGRRDNALEEIEFVKSRKAFTSVLEDSHASGDLPLRVTHNDTKMNNVLLDEKTRLPVCVIDLDTIMPGYSVNDFGDSVRFGTNTAAEDEKDLSKVHFSLSLFETYVKGFLKGCDGGLTDTEIELLPEGAKMMTLECGMRFLTDYIDGDNYFKTAYPEHNLVRCRTQFKLVSEMEQNWDKMKEIVKKYK